MRRGNGGALALRVVAALVAAGILTPGCAPARRVRPRPAPSLEADVGPAKDAVRKPSPDAVEAPVVVEAVPEDARPPGEGPGPGGAAAASPGEETAAAPRVVVIADFEEAEGDTAGFSFTDGQEFPGAKGRFSIAHEGKHGERSGRLEGDFTAGGVYVGIGKRIAPFDRDFAEVRFWAKSSEAGGLTFRMTDSTGQAHQQRPSFEADGEWHEVRIARFDSGPGYQTWGGAGDGKWHPPARDVSLSLEKGNLRGKAGAVLVDRIEATLSNERIVADFAVRPAAVGNVFMSNEIAEGRVAIPVETTADEVRWTATDFWRKEVAKGTERVADGLATIRPPARAGYFLLKMEPVREGAPGKARYTSYAVVPPHRVPDPGASPFGVMTHFAQGMDVRILPVLARAGIVALRDEHYWKAVEKERGVYTFPDWSGRYMKAAADARIDPLFVMTFENPLHDGGKTPHTPEGFDAYGRYGRAVLERYGRQVKWVEVWNEYNGSWCDGPAAEDRPRYYAQMIEHVYKIMKAARPDVKVLGCACVLIPLPYIEGIFKYGGLDHMDAVVIHPYRGRPEGVEEEVAELEDLIRKYNKGRDKPIWVTETGAWDSSEAEWEKGLGSFELGRAKNARYLVRQYALLLTRNVEKVFWYLASDHREFKTMGLLRGPDDPLGPHAVAPAYVTYATLIRMLDGARFAKREAERPYTRARVYLFRRRAGARVEEVRVLWATEPSRVALKCRGKLTMTDMMGGRSDLAPERGEVVLDLDETPFYVEGAVLGVEERDVGPRVLASTIEDYSKTQGAKGWHYGFIDGDGEGSGDGRAPSGPHTDDDFEPMRQKETMWGYEWAGPARYLVLARENAHPEVMDGRAVWSVRRWRSPVAGRVRIAGAFRHDRQGDGTGGKVLVDGRVVFEALVGGPKEPEEASFDFEAELGKGSLVDFCITPGAGTDLSYDATGYEARITEAE